MDQCSDTTVTTLTSSSPSHSPRSQLAVVTPCAACKILRRRCVDKCVLAPYFPPHDPLKFTTAHRVFGASNIIKFLQELPETQRADAVSSMVYEADARLRDPVYGSAGAIFQLQRQVNELQQQLAKAQAQLLNVQCQNANLTALICIKMSHQSEYNHHHHQQQLLQQHHPFIDNAFFLDESNLNGGLVWPEQLQQPLRT